MSRSTKSLDEFGKMEYALLDVDIAKSDASRASGGKDNMTTESRFVK